MKRWAQTIRGRQVLKRNYVLSCLPFHPVECVCDRVGVPRRHRFKGQRYWRMMRSDLMFRLNQVNE